MEADAELHTPQMNKIGLPDGMAEYALRRAIRDIIQIYGRFRGEKIIEEISDEETERKS
jgi:hypothetical protein